MGSSRPSSSLSSSRKMIDPIPVNPGLTEVPYNGKDDDCNATTLDDDLDSDGYPIATDCDDNDPGINPSAIEICNGIDDNCNGSIDEGTLTTFYADLDGDGFGDINCKLDHSIADLLQSKVGH